MYGSLTKRISVSIQKIISYFPAAIESTYIGVNYATGATATNIVYNPINNVTTFDLSIERLRNQFDIDFSVNSARNLSLREIEVSPLRDLNASYSKYNLYYQDGIYQLAFVQATNSLTYGTLTISVYGSPFLNQTEVYNDLYIRPNDSEVGRVFGEKFDEVEKFLLNRYSNPIYTSTFTVPIENEDGTYSSSNENLTWPLTGLWNIDILSSAFTRYLEQLNEIVENIDNYKTNLISRFLTTGAFKDFYTVGQKF